VLPAPTLFSYSLFYSYSKAVALESFHARGHSKLDRRVAPLSPAMWIHRLRASDMLVALMLRLKLGPDLALEGSRAIRFKLHQLATVSVLVILHGECICMLIILLTFVNFWCLISLFLSILRFAPLWYSERGFPSAQTVGSCSTEGLTPGNSCSGTGACNGAESVVGCNR
jgi:hypothetical protein